MTTEIDWSKAPEGATHVGTRVNDKPYWYKLFNSNWFVFGKGCYWVGIHNAPRRGVTKRPAGPLTFGELSRVEQIALFEHVLDDGCVEYFNVTRDKWISSGDDNDNVSFYNCNKYRKVDTGLQTALAERDVLYEQLDKLESQIDKVNDRIAELKGGK